MYKSNSLDSSHAYNKVTIFLHWVIALAFIGMVGGALIADNLEEGELATFLMFIHKSMGLLLLPLAWFSVIWRLVTPSPKPLPESTWMNFVAILVKGVMTLAILLQPLSGVVMSLYNGYPINFFNLLTIMPFSDEKTTLGAYAHDTHEVIGLILYYLIPIHVGAALFHHYILKDGVLKRMLGRNVQ